MLTMRRLCTFPYLFISIRESQKRQYWNVTNITHFMSCSRVIILYQSIMLLVQAAPNKQIISHHREDVLETII